MAVADSATAGENTPPLSLLQSALPGILSRAKVVVSPYPFATADDDKLRITVANSQQNAVVEVHGRLVTRNGEQNPFRFVIDAGYTRAPFTKDFDIGGGFVSNISAFSAGAVTAQGQTFVIVQIIRGAGAAAFVLGTLLSSYVTNTQPIGWPGTPIENSLEGKGFVRLVTGTRPGVGAELNEIAWTNTRWRLVYFQGHLTTDGTVITRSPRLSFNIGTPAFIHLPVSGQIDGSLNKYFSWFEGCPFNSDHSSNVSSGSLPASAILTAGQSIATNTENLQAGDQWDAPTFAVEEWLDL